MQYKRLKQASLLLLIFVFILISLGGLVRNKGAGLACPDWPLCFGQVVPPMDTGIFLEWFHRLIAGLVSLFVMGMGVYIFKNPDIRKDFSKYYILCFILLLIQAGLGGLTVLGLLHPAWVTLHLAIGLVFFGTILWITLEAGRLQKLEKNNIEITMSSCPVLRTVTWLMLGAVFLQALAGGLVSSNYAGLACPDFPKCLGEWIPPFEGLVRFQFIHRVGALVSTIIILGWVFLVVSKYSAAPRRLKVGVKVVPFLLFLQIALGIASVYLQLPVLLSVAHLAVATALFGKVLMMAHFVTRFSNC